MIKNYTSLYLEGFNKYDSFILEQVLQDQNVNRLFNDPTSLKSLVDICTEDQLRYIFYKIKNDLPTGSVTAFIDKLIEATKSKSYTEASNEILNLFKNYNVTIDTRDTRNVLKLYNSIQKPADLSQPPPAPLQNFGAPYVAPTTTTPSVTTTPPPTPSGGGSSSGSGGGTPPPAPGPGPGEVTNGKSSLGQEMDARGAQISQGSNYRQGSRTSGEAMRPISSEGGPTYYTRISPGRFRPAVQADMDAGLDLFMKNPNPIYAGFNPYVKVDKMAMKARRAGPVDQDAISREMSAQGIRRAAAATQRDFDREMSAQGYQKLGPGGKRVEADGSVRRNSKLGGVAGSLSNFFGDVGNTLKKKRP